MEHLKLYSDDELAWLTKVANRPLMVWGILPAAALAVIVAALASREIESVAAACDGSTTLLCERITTLYAVSPRAVVWQVAGLAAAAFVAPAVLAITLWGYARIPEDVRTARPFHGGLFFTMAFYGAIAFGMLHLTFAKDVGLRLDSASGRAVFLTPLFCGLSLSVGISTGLVAASIVVLIRKALRADAFTGPFSGS